MKGKGRETSLAPFNHAILKQGAGDRVAAWARLRAGLSTAVGTNDRTFFHQETTTNEAVLAFVAVKAFRVPILVFKCDELAATKATDGFRTLIASLCEQL